MEDVVSRLRRTRANMLGTDDGEHFYDCHDAADEIERLREWIRNTGTATDICTFVVLGEICENCRCGKDKMPNALGQEPCAAVRARSPAPTGCASKGSE